MKQGLFLMIFAFGLFIGCKKDLKNPNLVVNRAGGFKNSLLIENIGLEMGRKFASSQV